MSNTEVATARRRTSQVLALRPGHGPDPTRWHAYQPIPAEQSLRLHIEVAGDPVAPADVADAWEAMRNVARHSSRAVRAGRTHLRVDGRAPSSAIADTILLLDGDLVIFAGAIAPTPHEAIDQLRGRLRRRITDLREREATRVSD
jgi:ribosome-associated translation inhibitor RaiA